MDGLWVILLEAFVALCFLLGIVWATWPKEKPEQPHPQTADLNAPATTQDVATKENR